MGLIPDSDHPADPLDAPVANGAVTGYMSNDDSWSNANNMFQLEPFAEFKIEEATSAEGQMISVEEDTVTLTRKELNDLIKTSKSSNEKTGAASTPRNHPCPDCGRNFTRRFNMLTHLKTHDKSRYVTIELLTFVDLDPTRASIVKRRFIGLRTRIDMKRSIRGPRWSSWPRWPSWPQLQL